MDLIEFKLKTENFIPEKVAFLIPFHYRIKMVWTCFWRVRMQGNDEIRPVNKEKRAGYRYSPRKGTSRATRIGTRLELRAVDKRRTFACSELCGTVLRAKTSSKRFKSRTPGDPFDSCCLTPWVLSRTARLLNKFPRLKNRGSFKFQSRTTIYWD